MKKKTLVTRTLIILVAGLFILAYALRPLIDSWQESRALAAVDDIEKQEPVGPTFNNDSAYQFCADQCAFGPRTMNSQAHEQCRQWIVGKFQEYGLSVEQQSADLTGYDGTTLHATNIIASYQPEAQQHIVIAAHWDSRPWADNDHDEANWKQPVMAANDGASGVAVMLELARLLSTTPQGPNLGIDFVCFDAEDWGTPQWSDQDDDPDSWALGAQHWASQYAATKGEGQKSYLFGILLDMVGGEGARFYQEAYSRYYASNIVRKVWRAAKAVGKDSYFPRRDGTGVTDDHVPMNQVAGIPTIDIIPYYPDCSESSFGPTWHTIHDTMDHIDANTLGAVGQTLIQVIFGE
ncbi:MAG: M28 family peptidase [Prevotella sp.]|nr:M28 family peptidase [Prevotella sp.]